MDRDYHAPNCSCLFCERYKRVLGARPQDEAPTPEPDELLAPMRTADWLLAGAIAVFGVAVLAFVIVWLNG